jgi:class 3 adenylate cyclase
VNLAARLESHTKVVGEPILIDEATRLGLGPDILVEDRGAAELKGITEPVHIYSVKGFEGA